MYLIKNVRLYTGRASYERGAVITDGGRIIYAGDEASMTAPPIFARSFVSAGVILYLN